MFKTNGYFFHSLEEYSAIPLPELFTFPFYYAPHQLSKIAASQVQDYLENQDCFEHNFGLSPNVTEGAIGKMFGVLITKDNNGDLGYLAAFSGKLAESNHINGFVPPVYDNLNPVGFYKKGEAELNKLNRQIEALEKENNQKIALQQLQNTKKQYANELESLKTLIKQKKEVRKQKRAAAISRLAKDELAILNSKLDKESIYYHFRLKELKANWKKQIEQAELQYAQSLRGLNNLKEKRKNLSGQIQQRLHEQYKFLNANGVTQNLLDIFSRTNLPGPPSGSGECAAPKLLQFAYLNNYQPIALAEFWWGASPKSQVRKHKQFYPSCRGKCEPILGHMLQGLKVEPNPIEIRTNEQVKLSILYEDEYLLVVNKPQEFLSVPGRNIEDSVYTRMKAYLPDAKGPLLLHRLDMSTSGILIVAKNERTHKNIQKQFIGRTVKKRYVAILEGELLKKEGIISLPLAVDFNNRPQQQVCFKKGKPATTKYEVIEVKNGKTKVFFYPITGRTHQLRVHAAHSLGLNIPIVGDDLYGNRADRLYLHAEQIEFIHPVKKEKIVFNCPAPF